MSDKTSIKKIKITGLPSIHSTESRCCVCKKKERTIVPFNARIDVWIKKGVYIPPKNRTCKDHLKYDIFKKDIVNGIVEEKDHTLMNVDEICLWMETLNYIIHLKKKPLSFDSMVGFTDDAIYGLFGINMEAFESLLNHVKPHLKNSAQRSVRNSLAIFLMKLRLGIF